MRQESKSEVNDVNVKRSHTMNTAWSSQEYVSSRFANVDLYRRYAVQREIRTKAQKIIGIMCLVLTVIGIVVGIYLSVFMLEEDVIEPQQRSTTTMVPGKITWTDPPLYDVDDVSFPEDVHNTSRTVNETSPFKTDPICRNRRLSSRFTFDCFRLQTFLDLPKNNTVKCSYLNRAGKCMQFLLETRYGVNCTRLDRLYLLERRAKKLKRRIRFDVIKGCPDWFDFYYKELGKQDS